MLTRALGRVITMVIETPKGLPSIDRLVNDPNAASLVTEYGAPLVTSCAQFVINKARTSILNGKAVQKVELLEGLRVATYKAGAPSLKRVFNLTGTILNTNLGRSVLPKCAVQLITDIASDSSNLEFDLNTGKRGDRQNHIENLICNLTGAKGALVVNNNAAALLLILNSLANRKEVPVSRGELVEIGGSFRLPDIMARAGSKLVEVGTTNRTHAEDFERAISNKTALLLKVHTSNFEIKGFVNSVSEKKLSEIAIRYDLPFITDLGSGTLIDMCAYNLPHETTVVEAIKAGADLVTFSGDKLLGGPQAGIIVGRPDLINKLKLNAINRAVRPDKITLAALQSVLQLYMNPSRLETELPLFRWLSRDLLDIKRLANKLIKPLQKHCKGYDVTIETTDTQVGSGALPVAVLQSIALKITFSNSTRSGRSLSLLSRAFRELPIPVIGRITKDSLCFDLRCLEDERGFLKNLQNLKIP